MEPDGPSKKESHKESCQAADVLNTHSVSSVVTRGPYSCSHKMEGVKKQALKMFIFVSFFRIFFYTSSKALVPQALLLAAKPF